MFYLRVVALVANNGTEHEIETCGLSSPNIGGYRVEAISGANKVEDFQLDGLSNRAIGLLSAPKVRKTMLPELWQYHGGSARNPFVNRLNVRVQLGESMLKCQDSRSASDE